MATFLELCQRVREEIGFAGSGPTSVSDQTGQLLEVVNAVKVANLEVQNRWPNWNFLRKEANFTTVANQAVYTSSDTGWPTDLSRWDATNFAITPGTYGYMLTPIDYRDWQRTEQFTNPTAAKPVQIIFQPDNSWRLFPPPSGAYAIVAPYFRTPIALSADTDEPPFQSQYTDAIVFLAVKKLALRYEAPLILQYALEQIAYWTEKLDTAELPDSIPNSGYSELGSPYSVVAI